MRFPKIDDVAHDLRSINSFAEGECDVRLQMYDDGNWVVRFGLSDYDQDHRGFWGASNVPGNNQRFRSKDIARDLINEVKDAYYEATAL